MGCVAFIGGLAWLIWSIAVLCVTPYQKHLFENSLVTKLYTRDTTQVVDDDEQALYNSTNATSRLLYSM